MSHTELCVYKAKLLVAGYWYYREGRARKDVAIQWHGDETENEKEFVEHTIDEAYQTADADHRSTPNVYMSEQAFGDRAYDACKLASGT
jgi:hypothetical protein